MNLGLKKKKVANLPNAPQKGREGGKKRAI